GSRWEVTTIVSRGARTHPRFAVTSIVSRRSGAIECSVVGLAPVMRSLGCSAAIATAAAVNHAHTSTVTKDATAALLGTLANEYSDMFPSLPLLCTGPGLAPT